MTGTEGETPRESEVKSHSVFEEISDLLKWAHDRAAPLAFIGLSIATLLWLDFIKTNAIPVSFFSSSLIAGLPALFATVTFVVMVLTLNSVMPAFVLWVPLYQGGPALASSRLPAEQRNNEGVAKAKKVLDEEDSASRKISKATGTFINRWLAMMVLIGLAWACWILVASTHPKLSPLWALPVLFLSSEVLSPIFFWGPLKTIADQRPSFEFLCQLTASITLQNIVAFLVLYVALQTASNDSKFALAVRFLLYVITLVIIGAGQFIAAKRVAKGIYPDMLKHATVGIIALMAFVAVVPPLGGTLAAYPLSTEIKGHACTIFTAPSGSLPLAYAGVMDGKNPNHTHPLKFAFHFDDAYYVKDEVDADTVYAIPASVVGGFSGCQKLTDESGKP